MNILIPSFMNFIKKHKTEILENAFSYVVVLAMLVYGIGKIVQFNGAANIDLKISEMTGMQLMWAFYGYSKPFVYTLGFLEVSGGILMFFKRTRIIGCLLVSTILINVILQDIFYSVNVGALRAAILYQFLILLILYMNKKKIFEVWKRLTQFDQNTNAWNSKLFIWVLSFLLFVIFRIGEYYITTKW